MENFEEQEVRKIRIGSVFLKNDNIYGGPLVPHLVPLGRLKPRTPCTADADYDPFNNSHNVLN